jgi:hypothetical protein
MAANFRALIGVFDPGLGNALLAFFGVAFILFSLSLTPSYSKKDKICIVLFVSLGFVFRFLVDFPTGPCASTNGDFTGAQKSNAGETRPRLLLLRNGDDGEKNERSI